MFENDHNSTVGFEEEDYSLEADSGEQEGVVDSLESQDSDYADDGQEGAVGLQDEDGEEDDSDAGESEEEPGGADRDREKQFQTRQDNAAIRAARLRAEREADEKIARSGVINPYTGRPFQSVKEFESYGQQLGNAALEKEAKRTGKSVDALREEKEDREFLRKLKEQGKAADAAAKAAAARNAFIRQDAQEFVAKYPKVDVAKLENNQQFRRFCGSRFGKEPLAKLYEDYKGLVGEAESRGGAKVRSAKERSTGSGGGGGELLTAEQRKSLAAWNAANPEMRMTAKEFLGK